MAAELGNPYIWIDVDNPPQVQYLLPFADVFRDRGAEVVVTARDYGNALELLSQRTSSFVVIGREFGRSRAAKVTGVLRRARALKSLFEGGRRPDVLLCASRSSAIAARRMGIASFVIGDYEYANSSIYRLTRSTILYPDVIDPAPLLASGVRREQLRRVSRPQRGHLIRTRRDRRRPALLLSRSRRRRSCPRALQTSGREEPLLQPRLAAVRSPHAPVSGATNARCRHLLSAPRLASGRAHANAVAQ